MCMRVGSRAMYKEGDPSTICASNAARRVNRRATPFSLYRTTIVRFPRTTRAQSDQSLLLAGRQGWRQ